MKPIYKQTYDVAVIGGGVSGCAAAVAAAGAGATTIVVEQSGYLGGTLTNCGVGPMMTFHAGERQVVQGFMGMLVERLKSSGNSPGHVPDTKQYTPTITPFNAEALKLLLDQALEEAGAQVLLHTFLGGAEVGGDRIKGALVCNKDGLNTISAKIFVDATGDGDLAFWAGAPMDKGRPEDGECQPMSLMMKYCNVDTGVLKKYILEHPQEFPHLEGKEELISQDIPMDVEGFQKEMAEAKALGLMSIARENILMFATDRQGEYILNTTRIIGHDPADAESLSDAERVGRRQCAELDRLVRSRIPGFENAILEFTGPSVGARSSRQLRGIQTLAASDILDEKRDNAIAYSGYPIDIHNPKGEGTMTAFLQKKGGWYGIPFHIMTCLEFANLLVTGRCASATFEAQAAMRVTPTAGAMGQAAGIGAALAASGEVDVRKLDPNAVRVLLKAQGAYIE
ncbi:MAG: FAD-dependent oxidoreductase [Clostridiales bacterium]|nr:FAD-dependent oxidoreductase [Clostridiales bacterium]